MYIKVHSTGTNANLRAFHKLEMSKKNSSRKEKEQRKRMNNLYYNIKDSFIKQYLVIKLILF